MLAARLAAAMPRRKRVAARIVGDVRRRGDAALFAWTRRLDGVRLTPQDALGECERAARRLARRFRRSCAPRWSTLRAISAAWPKSSCRGPGASTVEPGVRVEPARDAARHDRLLHSRRALFAGFDAADDRDSGASGGSAAHRGGLPASQRGAAGGRGDAGRRRDRAYRRRAGHRRAGLWHALGARAWTKSSVREIATSRRPSGW